MKIKSVVSTIVLAAVMLLLTGVGNAAPQEAPTPRLTTCEIYVFTFEEIINKLNIYTLMYSAYMPQASAVSLAWATIFSEMESACANKS